MRKKRNSYFDSYFKESTSHIRLPCAHHGCQGHGVYPAPKSIKELYSYLFFCLDHIRDYNDTWNYYKDMTEEDILAQVDADMGWRRPTWSLKKEKTLIFEDSFYDEFDYLFGSSARSAFQFMQLPSLTAKEKNCLKLFELEWPFTAESLLKQYRTLVRKYHPDLNRGNKKYEEKLKTVNDAYQHLKKMIAV